MGSPCEVLVDTQDEPLARRLAALAEAEARRVEAKFSRYRPDSVVGRLNAAGGGETDPETAQLLDFAAECFRLSEGLFDVTAGGEVAGWDKVSWEGRRLALPEGARLDLGGVGKEYAVDRALALIRAECAAPALVNFGGDIAACGREWLVGIEGTTRVVAITSGGLTTSGDSRRPGHILDPRTGRPVEGAPRAVTVASGTCTEAGFLSTLGMLKGRDAEAFLREAGVRSWVAR